MKKISGLIGIVFLTVLIISFSSKLMREVANLRFSTKALGSDKYTYGDLFGMSYLKDFKIKLDFNSSDVKLDKYNTPAYNLFVAGDSYLGKSFVKNDSFFCGVNNYWYSDFRNEPAKIINLIPKQRNILLIETVERNLRYFDDSIVFTKIIMNNNDTGAKRIKNGFPFDKLYSLLSRNYGNDPVINDNIEFNLFDYKLFTPVKEIKANLNYKVFNRVNNDVMISPDKKYLLYKPTIDTGSWNSSFTKIDDEEINRIVLALNNVYRYYIANGFDEVYFSIIPNPVTMLYPGILDKVKYNELIPRIQYNANLKIPIIDVYELFRKTKTQIYFNSDTHWNNNGFYVWLNEFNNRMNEDIKL